MPTLTVGQYLAQRLEELGLADYFAIPGDFNLALLDEMLKHPRLRMINCCNELNMGYAADGYARERGVAAMVLTFAVGGLSAINAVAGAYAENLPVIVISGGPNLDALAKNRIIHHTRAKPQEGEHCVRMVYQAIAAHAVVIRDAGTAAFHIDEAIRVAMTMRKPVYIEVACNLAATPISWPHPLDLQPAGSSDPKSLAAALEHAASFLNRARQPVLVAGGKLRDGTARSAFAELAHACGYGVACMPDAKSFFSEQDPQFMGIYWGSVSSPGCREIVESSDAYLFAAPVFSDYTTVGFTALVRADRLVQASPDRILIAGASYHGIHLGEFLAGLAPRLKANPAALAAYGQIRETLSPLATNPETLAQPLTTRRLFHHIGAMLDGCTTVVAETGDSWFNGMDLKLPAGARFEVQMQYGSIGWSVGACLGLMVAHAGRRVIGLIGDGSFQMSAQEVSTMLRYGCSGVLFLLNNGGYTIEVKIHDGPYNSVQPWNYADLIKVFQDKAPGWGCVVRTEADLVAALAKASAFAGLSFIEVILDPKDCNKSLMAWGTAVAAYNAQPDPRF
jgi:indolepyruvate decarboxylase